MILWLKKITEAMRQGNAVNLSYEEAFFAFPWEGDTRYFINNVSIIKKDKDYDY